MKKIILLIVTCLFTCFAKADEPFWVWNITSKDSMIWVSINIPKVTYKIIFRGSKIAWGEEKNSTLLREIEKEKYENDIKDVDTKTQGSACAIVDGSVCFLENGNWKEVFHVPYRLINHLNIRDNGEILVGGYGLFFGRYHDGVFTRIFFIDGYELQNVNIDIRTEKEGCPEENPDTENSEEMGDDFSPYPSSVCFCDGRKIGYINDADGYVNFRSTPNMQAPIIGIILDRVRVFYWDDGNNGNWYKVEINNVEGYVHKSRIRS
jgi:hypothetical protein